MNKYFRYKLVFPYAGNKIYKSNSLTDAATKCYKEFSDLNDVQDGIFGIMNMDTNNEHKFKVSDGNLYKHTRNQKGGDDFSIYSVLDPVKPTVIAPSVPITKSPVSATVSSNILPDVQESSIKPVTESNNIYEIINNISNKINNNIVTDEVDPTVELVETIDYPVNAPIIDSAFVAQSSKPVVSNNSNTNSDLLVSSLEQPLGVTQQNSIIELLREINKNVTIIQSTLKDNQSNKENHLVETVEESNKYLQDVENPNACTIF